MSLKGSAFCLFILLLTLLRLPAQVPDTLHGNSHIFRPDTSHSFRLHMPHQPQENRHMKFRFTWLGQDSALITRPWTGDPHFICEYPREALHTGMTYEITVCFTFWSRPGPFSKMMGLLLSTGGNIYFHFTGDVTVEPPPDFHTAPNPVVAPEH